MSFACDILTGEHPLGGPLTGKVNDNFGCYRLGASYCDQVTILYMDVPDRGFAYLLDGYSRFPASGKEFKII